MTTKEENNSGWPVFRAFLLFFVSFCCVDAYFVYKALTTHTGVVEENYYERGLNYDRVLEKAKAQESYQSEIIATQNFLDFSLHSIEGAPITDAVVQARYMRPVGDKKDFTAELAAAKNGLYKTPISLPQRGAWIIRIKATWLDQQTQKPMSYQIEQPFLAK